METEQLKKKIKKLSVKNINQRNKLIVFFSSPFFFPFQLKKKTSSNKYDLHIFDINIRIFHMYTSTIVICTIFFNGHFFNV